MTIFRNEVAVGLTRDFFGWRAEEGPSRDFGKLTAKLGATAILAGIILNREVYDAMGLDQAAVWSGYVILVKGVIEYISALNAD